MTMKSHRLIPMVVVLFLAIVQIPAADAQFGDFLKKFQKSLGVGGGLSTETIIDGLKEALEIGTKNAVNVVSQFNGYYKNPKIRIPLPGAVQKVEKVLRTMGFGSQVDAFELSMNRAAEKAAPKATAIFWDAIKQMSFTDARKILDGGDNTATLYFKEKTTDRLYDLFSPIVNKTMSQVGVTRQYQELDQKVSAIPFTESLRFDLDDYVTNKSLDGLFLMLAEEEKKIRQNPAARVTPLLKEVFGGK
ncbi:DUF4197 domain-containing protein [bacterium]|nr:DUF4197 domain-containing protein [bacterium]